MLTPMGRASVVSQVNNAAGEEAVGHVLVLAYVHCLTETSASMQNLRSPPATSITTYDLALSHTAASSNGSMQNMFSYFFCCAAFYSLNVNTRLHSLKCIFAELQPKYFTGVLSLSIWTAECKTSDPGSRG